MAGRLWETEKPRNLEAMGWAFAWYRVDRQETRKSKSGRSVYFLYAEVVNDEDEKYRAGDVLKETGGGGFEETEGGEKRDEAKV